MIVQDVSVRHLLTHCGVTRCLSLPCWTQDAIPRGFAIDYRSPQIAREGRGDRHWRWNASKHDGCSMGPSELSNRLRQKLKWPRRFQHSYLRLCEFRMAVVDGIIRIGTYFPL